MENLKEKVKNLTKKAVDISIFIASLFVAFIVGYYFNVLTQTKKIEQNKFANPNTSQNISVSVTDRNELLIINRQTQTIEVYQDTIGYLIFKSYAKRLVTNQDEQ